MRGGRRLPDRPGFPSSTSRLNSLPSMTTTLRGGPSFGFSRAIPDPYYDAPHEERQFNPVVQGPAAEKLLARVFGKTDGALPKRARCKCCGERPHLPRQSLCAFCAWLLK